MYTSNRGIGDQKNSMGIKAHTLHAAYPGTAYEHCKGLFLSTEPGGNLEHSQVWFKKIRIK